MATVTPFKAPPAPMSLEERRSIDMERMQQQKQAREDQNRAMLERKMEADRQRQMQIEAQKAAQQAAAQKAAQQAAAQKAAQQAAIEAQKAAQAQAIKQAAAQKAAQQAAQQAAAQKAADMEQQRRQMMESQKRDAYEKMNSLHSPMNPGAAVNDIKNLQDILSGRIPRPVTPSMPSKPPVGYVDDLDFLKNQPKPMTSPPAPAGVPMPMPATSTPQAGFQSVNNATATAINPQAMKRGGAVKKHAGGGKINIANNKISTHQKSKKSPNW